MRPTRFLSALALLCFVACAQQSSHTAGDSTPAARLDGVDITVGEVDVWIKEELFRQASNDGNEAKLHEIRSQAIDNIINERLVEREAKIRGVDSDQLMDDEAKRRMAVGDAEILEFWERNKASMGSLDFAAAAVQIRSHLERQKGPKAARAFVQELRKDAEIEVMFKVPRTEVAASGPAMGPEDAPVTIVEFSDYQCPFCARAEPIISEVLKRYEGQVRFVYRHFPLDSIHKNARGASEAAACANEQGKFWPYHARLFVGGADLTAAGLESHAVAVEADLEAFRTCVQERRYKGVVETDVAEGRSAGVTGTPAFFVNGIVLKGAQPVDEFVRIIDAELAAAAEEAESDAG